MVKISEKKHITRKGVVKRNPSQAIWRIKGKGSPIIEVYEDFQGDLWFVAEKTNQDNYFGYARLYHMPDCAEWGYIPSLKALKRDLGEHKVWEVPKRNWSNINTYQSGLFVKDEIAKKHKTAKKPSGLSKTQMELIKTLEGNEIYYSDWGVVGIAYPYVWYRGEKKKLSAKQWKELLEGYSKNPDNDGYWLMKEMRKEFGD